MADGWGGEGLRPAVAAEGHPLRRGMVFGRGMRALEEARERWRKDACEEVLALVEDKGDFTEHLRRVREKLEEMQGEIEEDQALRLLEEAAEEVEDFGARLEEDGR